MPVAQTHHLEAALVKIEHWAPQALKDEIKRLQEHIKSSDLADGFNRALYGADTSLYPGFCVQMIETSRIKKAALGVAIEVCRSLNAKTAWERLEKLTDLSSSPENAPPYSVHLVWLINAVLNSRKGLSSLPKGTDATERKGTAATERKRLVDDLKSVANRLNDYQICATVFDAFTQLEIDALASQLSGNTPQKRINYDTDFIISSASPTLPNLLLRLAHHLEGQCGGEVNGRIADPFLFRYQHNDFVGVDNTRGIDFENLSTALVNEFKNRFGKPLYEVVANLCSVFFPERTVTAKTIEREFKKSTPKID